MDLTKAANHISLNRYSDAAKVNFQSADEAYRHYVCIGQFESLNPSPYFFTDWYKWQQGGCIGYLSPLDHFVEHGAKRNLDPSPFIDSLGLLNQEKYDTIVRAHIELVHGPNTVISPNIADHYQQLKINQDNFYYKIAAKIIKVTNRPRRNLVWIQAGSDCAVFDWFEKNTSRTWDLLFNWYASDQIDLSIGDTHLLQPGTKTTAIRYILENHSKLIDSYERVLFLDDDISLNHCDIDTLFHHSEINNLSVFQPALSARSHGTWPDLFARTATSVRETTGTEIMMPGFTMSALRRCEEAFKGSISGFGVDLAYSEVLRNNGETSAVLDPVIASHLKPIDESDGQLYSMLRSFNINPKLELFQIMEHLGKKPDFSHIRNL